MAFFKTSKGPVTAEALSESQFGSFEKQAQETCQNCGRRKVADDTGAMVCKTSTCERVTK